MMAAAARREGEGGGGKRQEGGGVEGWGDKEWLKEGQKEKKERARASGRAPPHLHTSAPPGPPDI